MLCILRPRGNGAISMHHMHICVGRENTSFFLDHEEMAQYQCVICIFVCRQRKYAEIRLQVVLHKLNTVLTE